jgi:sulfoxide reductase catalytic subunit YedY
MLIGIIKPWEIPGLRPTDEKLFLNRRTYLKSLGLGAAMLAGGCDYQGPKAVIRLIGDYKEPAPYNPTENLNERYTLDRPVTAEQKVTTFNNFYEFSARKTDVYKKVENFTISPWTVEVTGLVKKPKIFDIDEIKKMMPLEERLYRFRCVEAWAMAVPWMGFRFSELIKKVEPKPAATHVRFVSILRPSEAPNQKLGNYPWPYREGLTIDEAMNELTFIATGLYGKPLAKQNGAPIRLVTPWKYGFKSIKSIVRIEFTNEQPSTFWNYMAPREYDFWANVNPNVRHPRWSQVTEKMIGTGKRYNTVLYNGYGKLVASLYG